MYRAEDHWLRSAIRQALKWIILLTLGMTLAGLIDLYKRAIVDVGVTTVAQVFTGVSLVVAVAALYYAADPPKRRPRRRRPWPR